MCVLVCSAYYEQMIVLKIKNTRQLRHYWGHNHKPDLSVTHTKPTSPNTGSWLSIGQVYRMMKQDCKDISLNQSFLFMTEMIFCLFKAVSLGATWLSIISCNKLDAGAASQSWPVH